MGVFWVHVLLVDDHLFVVDAIHIAQSTSGAQVQARTSEKGLIVGCIFETLYGTRNSLLGKFITIRAVLALHSQILPLTYNRSLPSHDEVDDRVLANAVHWSIEP